MVGLSYISECTLNKLDKLKKKLDSYKGRRSLQLHSRKRAALEQDALNTSLYIEYPEYGRRQSGNKNRQSKKLLGRLETAWRYCLANIGRDHEITQRDLEVVQSIIVAEGKLGIRQTDKDNADINLKDVLQPPIGLLVPELLAKLLEELEHYRTNSHPVEYSTFFHIEFFQIHPFKDGNGRTARLLQNYMLHQRGYPPVIIAPHQRELYFSLVDSAKSGLLLGDARTQKPFYEFISARVIESLEVVLEK